MSQDPLSQTSYFLQNSFEGKSYMDGTGFFVKRKKIFNY